MQIKGTEAEVMAYTAGLIDGEGCFSIQKSGGTYRTTIQVAMTSREAIDWCYTLFGGHQSVRPPTESNEEIHLWVMASKPKIVKAIDQLIPYLRVKFLPAWILREFCQKFSIGKSARFSDTEINDMGRYHELLMLANSKGPGSNALKAKILKVAGGTSA